MKKLFKIILLPIILSLILVGCNQNTTKEKNIKVTTASTIEPTETEKTIKLTSEEIEYAKKIAIPLSQQLIQYGFNLPIIKNKIYYKDDINTAQMMWLIFKYPDSPYYDENQHKNNMYNYSKDLLEKFYFEVFEINKLNIGLSESQYDYDEQEEIYHLYLEFGIDKLYDLNNVVVNYLEPATIKVNFDLMSEGVENGDPSGVYDVNNGSYSIIYQIFKNDENSIFLRFKKLSEN